jgi:pyruvate formate lyase activating enzyme
VARQRDPEVETLDQILKRRTVPGDLYEKLEGSKVRCFACGHRCLIPDGHDGICRVRFNRGGTLLVPRGYVAGLQVDPIEKKPFFHAFPGAVALSFGMLGCDFHCGYCFPGDTRVVTDRGPISLAEAFAGCRRVDSAPGAEIGYPDDLRAVAGSGSLRKVRAVFKHRYEGPLAVVRPYYLPALRCTPDHRVYATDDPDREPQPVQARDLTPGHYLAIPRSYAFSATETLSLADLLARHRVLYSARWKLTESDRRAVADATARGETSRQIAARLGTDASYVRHVRSKLSRGRGSSWRTGGLLAEGDRVRFPNERRPGIPAQITLDRGLARLLGYYCAEGSVIRERSRPNSYDLVPSIYETARPQQGTIQGRAVHMSPCQVSVVWYAGAASPVKRRVRVSERFHLVPIRSIECVEFDGDVFNMEVEEEHNYLAGFFLVSNCQNWLTSQALRDNSALAPPRDIEPEEIVATAKRLHAPAMVTTYNEPLITSEWAVEVFKVARAAGITCGYVSNGNGTPEVLRYIRPFVDLYKVDLKSFRDAEYRQLGGKLENVLATIRSLWEMGFWVEIVTLVVPGFNDSDEELRDIARFLASVSKDIPWHVTAFHKDYKMTENASTTVKDLLRAVDFGKAEGLRYVYAGNLPGRVGDLENTRCPRCNALVIERLGYKILSYRLEDPGQCPDCGEKIAGFWRSGWQVPENDGGLPGRHPQSLHVEPAALAPGFTGKKLDLVDRTPPRR